MPSDDANIIRGLSLTSLANICYSFMIYTGLFIILFNLNICAEPQAGLLQVWRPVR